MQSHNKNGPEADTLLLADGSQIAISTWRRPGASRIAFSHGVGLAVGAYRHFLDMLAQRYEVIGFDLRGHGASAEAVLPQEDVLEQLVADIEGVWWALDERFGRAPTAGVFHSVSGLLALEQTLRHGARWGALALLDPPLTPSEHHPLMAVKKDGTKYMMRGATARRERYSSVAAFAGELAKRSKFSLMEEGAHALLAGATLKREPATGDFVLCVPGKIEAQLYRENLLPQLQDVLRTCPVPVRLICSDPNGPYASPIPVVCAAIAEECAVDMETVEGTTHMLPLENPEACVEAVTDFLAANGFPPAG